MTTKNMIPKCSNKHGRQQACQSREYTPSSALDMDCEPDNGQER